MNFYVLTNQILFNRWVWAASGAQPELETALGIGGFGYPVSCVIENVFK